MTGLTYAGDGSAFPDVPPRDLSSEEVDALCADISARQSAFVADWFVVEGEEGPTAWTPQAVYDQLIASGLYTAAAQKAAPKAPVAPATSEG